jgi:Spy/CpxP family protein refolding chaperone
MKQFVIAVLMIVTLATGLLAQRGRGPDGPGGTRPEPTAALKDALGLTDAQVEAIKTLVQAQQSRVQAIRTEIEQKHQALDTLLSAASPSPVDVGNAAIALRATENRLQAERTALINQIKQQLTGEQQQKLDALVASGRGLPLPGLGGRGQRGGR